MKEYKVSSSEVNQTLEKFVKKHLANAPLSFIYKIFRKKDVKVNSKRTKDLKFKVKEGDIVQIYVSDEQLLEFAKKEKEVDFHIVLDNIIYEDENLIIINKPKGLLVQKDSKNSKALDDMVRSYLISKNPELKDNSFISGPAHRLDRNTSGIILFGKNIETLQILLDAFKTREGIKKEYLALLVGRIAKSGKIDTPLLKNAETGLVKTSTIANGGKNALTLYRVKEYIKDYSLVEIELCTGRTHQIRCHFSSINYPVVGDRKYGDFRVNKEFENLYNLENQFLHASKLTFINMPGKLSYLNGRVFKADLPSREQDILVKLKNLI